MEMHKQTKFLLKLGKTATEPEEMFKTVY